MDAEGPKATLEAMKDVMRFWLGMGCDGFRVDMAGSLVKNDEDGKGTIKLWQNVREFLDREFPEAAMVSEWGEPDKSIQGGFHMDFLLHFGPSHYNDLSAARNLSSPTEARAMFPSSWQSIRRITKSPRKRAYLHTLGQSRHGQTGTHYQG